MNIHLPLTVIIWLSFMGFSLSPHNTNRLVLAQNSKPFILPVSTPPGPETWLLGQPYGNTIGAYLRGDDWYSAGQRLHFGLDFSMVCGTPLVAIGDGEVIFVDSLGFGSAPHNLLIRHDAGVVSLYGHLLDRAVVNVGDRVNAGDLVGYSGDPDLTCTSRPHLHLELRSLDYQTTYNPVDYINANWHMLASIGGFRYPVFEQDLDNARQWMSLDAQPNVVFGGRALNLYVAPYPDYRNGQPLPNPPLERELLPLDETVSIHLQQVAFTGCCTGAWWDPLTATHLYAIDGVPNQRANIFQWDLQQEMPTPNLVMQAPPSFASADGTHHIIPLNEQEFSILNTVDNIAYTVNTGGAFPSLSSDNSKILFLVTAEPSDLLNTSETSIWIANIDGSNAHVIASVMGGSAQWLDANRLLISSRGEQSTRLSVYDTSNGAAFTLGQWERLRVLSIAPGGERLMFYLTAQTEQGTSGTYTIQTQDGAVAQHLPWFGAWEWRDANSVYYLPFEPSSIYHTIRVYDVITGEDRALTDPTTHPFLVANGDWSVSSDGRRIAFWNALDMTTWVFEFDS